VAANRLPDDVLGEVINGGVAEQLLELGDPGTTHDISHARASLPPYVGPTEPAGGHVHEWGAAAAELSDDTPLEGPALAPYGQAAAEDPEQPG
jgi:hypothetical protein